ncbi:MAG: methylmalonyl-CoA epimerase [Alphaproteobacteria bacterium]|nr:MAG: methylmalonyl-CoA epimerase [Alphaproteobacteria bacterium]
MIGRLNHVCVATPNLDDAVKLYRDVLGATVITEKRTMAEQGVSFQFVNLANSQIELIEPYGENSPILNFLAKNPQGGQHHICFEVEDIYKARDELVAKGVRALGEPRIGAHGTLIVFMHPKDMGGQLIELMETPKGEHH